MARRSQKHWSYRTGEKGVNRVRVFAHGPRRGLDGPLEAVLHGLAVGAVDCSLLL